VVFDDKPEQMDADSSKGKEDSPTKTNATVRQERQKFSAD